MVAGTVVVLVSLPIYWTLYRAHGAIGLAAASDIGIAIQTATLAAMLDRRKMVSLSGLEFREIGRSAAAAAASFGAIYGLRRAMPASGRWQDAALLAAATAAWAGVAFAVLKATGSGLPEQLLGRVRRKSRVS
jgi:putative peptidoglycan lipid II flippase